LAKYDLTTLSDGSIEERSASELPNVVFFENICILANKIYVIDESEQNVCYITRYNKNCEYEKIIYKIPNDDCCATQFNNKFYIHTTNIIYVMDETEKITEYHFNNSFVDSISINVINDIVYLETDDGCASYRILEKKLIEQPCDINISRIVIVNDEIYILSNGTKVDVYDSNMAYSRTFLSEFLGDNAISDMIYDNEELYMLYSEKKLDIYKITKCKRY